MCCVSSDVGMLVLEGARRHWGWSISNTFVLVERADFTLRGGMTRWSAQVGRSRVGGNGAGLIREFQRPGRVLH